jgi:hypothetical protein
MSTYTSEMYSNFIFGYIKFERERERQKNERMRKKSSKPEPSPFIMDISMISIYLSPGTEWHSAQNNLHYLHFYFCFSFAPFLCFVLLQACMIELISAKNVYDVTPLH